VFANFFVMNFKPF